MKAHYSQSLFNLMLAFALAAALLGSAAIAKPAHAGTQMTVTTSADTVAADGHCSLREAIQAANTDLAVNECPAGSGFDSINFSGPETITLTGPLPQVTTSIYIQGNSASATIVQASTCNPVTLPGACTPASFGNLFSVSAAGNLIISGMTVRYGNADSSTAGGAFYALGNLNVSAVVIDSNSAKNGGGIYTGTGTILNLYDDQFTGNRATSAGGGGIYNDGGTVSLTGSTLSGNIAAASGNGGGILNPSGADATLANDTFYNNSAASGGGIYNAGTMTADNLTVSNNSASVSGGGVFSNATLTVKNNIIANSSSGGDCVGSGTVTGKNNLILDSSNACGFSDGVNGNIVGHDPLLGSLTDNGGGIPTMAITTSSPAYNAGDDPTCSGSPVGGTDERGYTRPSPCDIGAFELHLPPANDNIASATVIGSLPYSNTVDAYGATSEGTDPVICAGSNHRTAWYTFTAPATMQVEVNTYHSSYDTVLEVWTGSPGSLSSVVCNDDYFVHVTSRVHFLATSGTQYYIEVASFGSDAGSLTLGMTQYRVSSDFDGDHATDPAKFYTGTGTAWWLKSSTSAWDGLYLGSDVGSYVARSDFDGDGKVDPAKWVSSTNTLWYFGSSDSTWHGIYMGSDVVSLIPGTDFDGDGKTDPAKYIATGYIWYFSSLSSTWKGVYIGTDGTPLAGSDFDGDGKADAAKYVSSSGTIWYYGSSDSTWHGLYIGNDGAVFPSSDLDGDGKTDPAKFLSSTNTLWFFASSDSAWHAIYLGPGTITPIGGLDFDGDGRVDPATFNSSTDAMWYQSSGTGNWSGVVLGNDTFDIAD